MKKAILVLLVLTIVGAMVFADDTVNWRWGARIKTGALITLADSTTQADPMIQAWDADDPQISRIRLSVGADVGDYSLDFKINTDLNSVGQADAFRASNWWITALFLDKMVALRFGSIDKPVTDSVNKGWGGLNLTGGQVVVTPMAGLDVGLAVPVSAAPASVNSAFAGMKVGFAYTMTDLVTVKATYMNASGTNNSNAAFGVALLMVPNLTAQVEANLVSIGNAASTIDLTGAPATGYYELFENVEYKLGSLTPGIELDQVLWTMSTPTTKPVLSFKPKVDYMVMEGLNVGASVKYIMNVDGIADGTMSGLVVDPYLKFTFNTKASLKIDAAYTIPDLATTSTWMLPININFMWVF